MIRVTSLVLLVASAVGLVGGAARAQQLPVAPPPREIRSDGSRDPVPQPAKAEDPAAVVDRIIKNSKDVGDRLEKTDTGTDTRSKQDKILSDIDSLINRQEDPPPPKPDENKDKEKDKNDKNDKNDKKDDMNKDPMMKDMPPMKGDMPPMDKKGMGMGKDDMMPMPMGDPPPMPMGGGRRPRMGDPMAGDKKDPAEQKPDPMKPNDKKGGKPDPKDPKNPGGMAAGNPNGKVMPKATLPTDEDVSKDVWGHLPDKLRQQMTQYYKEDVMPKYAELLRLYYSSLSDKGTMPVPPKK